MGHEAVAYVSGISFHGLKAEYPWDGIRQILHMASKGYLEKPVEKDVKWAIFIEHFLCVEHGCNIYISIILNNLTKQPNKKPSQVSYCDPIFTTEENMFWWVQ